MENAQNEAIKNEVHKLQSFLTEIVFLTRAHNTKMTEREQSKLLDFALKTSYASLARANIDKVLSVESREELVSVCMLCLSVGHFLGETKYLETYNVE